MFQKDEVIIERETVTKAKRIPRVPVLSALAGILIAILFAVIFLFSLYTKAFADSVSMLLGRIGAGEAHMPFWLAAIMVIVFFPLTLGVIVFALLVNAIAPRHAKI